jgi:hypothetical protein
MRDTEDMCSMLSRLQSISGYDLRLVSVSTSYVKTEQRVSLDASCTVKKLVEMKFPWIKLHAEDFSVGFGVCANNEPRAMTWNRGRVVLNAELQDLWANTALCANEEYLLVCCSFEREQYKVQKDRLVVVLDEMGKWIRPE